MNNRTLAATALAALLVTASIAGAQTQSSSSQAAPSIPSAASSDRPESKRAVSLEPSALHELDGDQKLALYGGMTADELEGSDIVNPKGDKIGDVNKFLAASNDEVVGVLAESGGLFGIGATAVIVPITELRYDADKKSFIADMTANQLKAKRKVTRGLRGNLK